MMTNGNKYTTKLLLYAIENMITRVKMIALYILVQEYSIRASESTQMFIVLMMFHITSEILMNISIDAKH